MQFIVALLLGCLIFMAGVIIGRSSIKVAKQEKEDDPDDWWKRGEPAPWEREDYA